MKIEVLFPELCNLYGDLANIRYLKMCAEEIEVINTSIKSEPFFAENTPDMIYIGSMSEHTQELVIEKLSGYKERILSLIDEGVIFLATGNALEIFGDKIVNEDGTEVKCLGIFNTVAKRKMFNRFNSLYLGEFYAGSSDGNGRANGDGDVDGCADDDAEAIEIVGFKSQFTHSYGEETPLFNTKRGPGLNPDIKGEGLRRNNFMATYVLGPILILNPLFTKKLLEMLGISEPELAYGDAAMESYEIRLKEFSDPNRGFYY